MFQVQGEVEIGGIVRLEEKVLQLYYFVEEVLQW